MNQKRLKIWYLCEMKFPELHYFYLLISYHNNAKRRRFKRRFKITTTKKFSHNFKTTTPTDHCSPTTSHPTQIWRYVERNRKHHCPRYGFRRRFRSRPPGSQEFDGRIISQPTASRPTTSTGPTTIFKPMPDGNHKFQFMPSSKR
jgi:hypothetical protein